MLKHAGIRLFINTHSLTSVIVEMDGRAFCELTDLITRITILVHTIKVIHRARVP